MSAGLTRPRPRTLADTLPDLIANSTTFSDWLYVRETANHYSNAPVTDVTSEAIRCYELDYDTTPGETSIATVQAGTTVGFQGASVRCGLSCPLRAEAD